MSELVPNDDTSPDLRDMFRAVDRMASEQERSAALTKMLFPTEEEQITEILTLVRRIVSSGWDNEWASDEEGNQVEEWRDDAVNFNLLAAVLKAGNILEDAVDVMVHSKAANLVFAEIGQQAGDAGVNIHSWQTAPERTREDVLNVIDSVSEKMKAGSDGR